jgi:hypothetical protein
LNTRTDSQASDPANCGISFQSFRSAALVALIAASLPGCGQDSQIDRKPIFGKIVGAEGRDGMVTFMPINAKIGPVATLSFKDGTYQFSNEDGPVPGEYEVTIELIQVAAPSTKRKKQAQAAQYRDIRVPRGEKLIIKSRGDGSDVIYEPERTAAVSNQVPTKTHVSRASDSAGETNTSSVSVPTDGPYEVDLTFN